MRDTEIKFQIQLDNQNIPTIIKWDATDKPEDGFEETKAIGISIWDSEQKGALRVDLWTNELEVGEMKRFCIESLGGMADTLLNATGDQVMRDIMIDCVKKLAKHLEEEEIKAQQ